jgi:hypothetical protein
MRRMQTAGASMGRQGPIGLSERLEPIVRRVTARDLGLPESILRTDVSFERDLAVDRALLATLVVAVERACAVSLSAWPIERLQTYGDLVDAVVDARLRRDRESEPKAVVFLRATLAPGPGSHRGMLTRSAWWSPYAKAVLVEDARLAGAGATLTITVPPGAPLATVEHIERELSDLASVGIAIDVQHARVSRGRAVA